MDHGEATCITKKRLMEELASYPDDFPIFFGLKMGEDTYRFTGYVFIGAGQFNTHGETDTHFHITLEDKKVNVGNHINR